MSQSLPLHLKDLARRVAQHEMGHYVVARALGFRTGDVTIELTGLHDGHRGTAAVTLPAATGAIDEIVDYLRRRIIVLYAGCAAEALPYYGSPSKTVDAERAVETIRNPGNGAEQDHAKARELVHVIRNITRCQTDTADDATTQGEVDAIDLELFGRAIELVEEKVDTILGLAGNLSDRVKAIRQPVLLDAAYLEALPAVGQIALAPTLRPESGPVA